MNRYSVPKRHTVVIHDARGLKNFWEEIIETHTKQRKVEDSRITRSALHKWVLFCWGWGVPLFIQMSWLLSIICAKEQAFPVFLFKFNVLMSTLFFAVQWNKLLYLDKCSSSSGIFFLDKAAWTSVRSAVSMEGEPLPLQMFGTYKSHNPLPLTMLGRDDKRCRSKHLESPKREVGKAVFWTTTPRECQLACLTFGKFWESKISNFWQRFLQQFLAWAVASIFHSHFAWIIIYLCGLLCGCGVLRSISRPIIL